MPGLAEAAAAHAAAEELDVDLVLDDLGRGDDGIGRVRGGVKILDDALLHLFGRAVDGRDGSDRAVVVIGDVIQAGHIDAADLRSLAQKGLLAPALGLCPAQEREELVVHLLALADDEEVHKGRHRLAVHAGRAAREHDRQEVGPVRAAQRDAGHVEHVEHGGVGHLIADGEGQNVKLGKAVAAFERIEGHARLFHFLVHVAPRSEGALAPDEGQAVHRFIQDLHAQIRHADLIGVREAEGQAELHLVLVFDDLVILAAGIARWLLHARQDAFQSFIHDSLRIF